jgi:hypothetical protein
MRAIVFSTLLLAGCAGDVAVPPSKLEKPAAYLMVAPEPLFNVAAGDDYGQALVKTRKMYGKETSKLRRLQRWIRVIQR